MGGGRGGGGGGGAVAVDADTQMLIDKIKAFQKTGEESKQIWHEYCDSSLGGVRDPARHDWTVLNSFCQNYGLDGPMPPQQLNKGAGKAQQVAIDPAKADLVNLVKNFQRASPANKETWYAFCGPVRDPNRHDAARLE